MNNTNTKKALIFAAHGSRKPSSNQEIEQFAKKLELAGTEHWHIVTAAFLEFAQPSIESTIEKLIAQGFQEITLFPFFTAAGKHVTKDLPQIISQTQLSHPEVRITQANHLGNISGLLEIILQELTAKK
jgi:sirohydrochlorin ferrochelatase